MSRTAIIILGATSAIAQQYARLQAERGARLLLVGRDSERLAEIAADLTLRGAETVEIPDMDLTAPTDGYQAAWTSLASRLGERLDIVLLAYGALGHQDAAEADPAETVRLLNANMVSACAWLTAAANHLERQGHGTIAAIASVAGDRGRRSNYVYGAAKGGLALFMEGLTHRLAGTPVRVLTVKPGLVDTPMTDDMNKNGPLWATPAKVAADIDKAIARGRTVLYTPWFWRPIMLVIRCLPRVLFHRLRL
ncbi:SDR family oxidoreductase [Telmatospirillum siberiense]|uniref:Short-chain dehydrogenase n=1 Tax=Telmatospirillum siberiense TaxID=382514 RepID=A0A2N3PQT3_9PROT|nr:SDR family oxidoreductase [Telmatospirillum siberiense]PKU22759.1 short-chain dehydrogenase [Telmatospirillum siberiense]